MAPSLFYLFGQNLWLHHKLIFDMANLQNHRNYNQRRELNVFRAAWSKRYQFIVTERAASRPKLADEKQIFEVLSINRLYLRRGKTGSFSRHLFNRNSPGTNPASPGHSATLWQIDPDFFCQKSRFCRAQAHALPHSS